MIFRNSSPAADHRRKYGVVRRSGQRGGEEREGGRLAAVLVMVVSDIS